jgi:chromate transporter
VTNAAISFGRSYLGLWRDLALALLAASLFILGTSPFLVILLAASIGIIIYRDRSIPTMPVTPMESPRTAMPLLFIVSAAAIGFIMLFVLHRGLFDMATLMFRIDLFAFGGGFASLPLMLHEVVYVKSWMDYKTFMNGIALVQVTPVPIVITTAFVGYMVYGPIGGIVATLGIFLPSFLLVIGTVPYYDKLSSSPTFNMAVKAIMCSFVGLLASVAFHLASNISWDLPYAIIATVALIALIFKVDILWVVLAGAIISILIF